MTPHREIPLTRGLVALVDEADYDAVVAAGKWHPKPDRSGLIYVHRNLKRDGTWTTQSLHRFLVSGFLVDHINGDPLDNRRANLRPSDRSRNMQNLHRPNGRSGFKGVSWHTKSKKWAARITINRKTRHLGYFASPELAAATYDAAATELFGQFACLNLPTQPEE